ncbi:MAG: bifunctional 4'-phosphopantothenoylcysteine decarboxylase/phosphopantothenoylcysteine synthetase, partial [Pseudoalteromonas sp.]|nr:bifunctional 4'-phosphopantothenoylcysteine decarboxylase/phosphopantothenoylcysteine synthetase [Pseudoalteromonas sp.]
LGFNSDHNALTLFWHNEQQDLAMGSKKDLAMSVMTELAKRL